MIDDSTVVAAVSRVLASKVGDEVVMLHLDRGLYFGLDQTGARIWQLIQEPRSIADVCRLLTEEYDVDADRCRASVIRLCGELLEAKLIERRDAIP